MQRLSSLPENMNSFLAPPMRLGWVSQICSSKSHISSGLQQALSDIICSKSKQMHQTTFKTRENQIASPHLQCSNTKESDACPKCLYLQQNCVMLLFIILLFICFFSTSFALSSTVFFHQLLKLSLRIELKKGN